MYCAWLTQSVSGKYGWQPDHASWSTERHCADAAAVRVLGSCTPVLVHGQFLRHCVLAHLGVVFSTASGGSHWRLHACLPRDSWSCWKVWTAASVSVVWWQNGVSRGYVATVRLAISVQPVIPSEQGQQETSPLLPRNCVIDEEHLGWRLQVNCQH